MHVPTPRSNTRRNCVAATGLQVLGLRDFGVRAL